MRLWVHLEDTPYVAFLVPWKNTTNEQLVGFHLSLSMGYVQNATIFCMSTETIADMANMSMGNLHHAQPHPSIN